MYCALILISKSVMGREIVLFFAPTPTFYRNDFGFRSFMQKRCSTNSKWFRLEMNYLV